MNERNDEWEEAVKVLIRALENIAQSMCDDYVKRNAEFRSNAGLKPKIIRRMRGETCEWCRALAGTYPYGEEPREVYQRHDNCDCTVEYVTEKGSQNVHTKRWTTDATPDKIEARKQVGLAESTAVIANKYKRYDYSKAVFAGKKDINWHWEKHCEEFSGWTKKQYLSRARELLMLPLKDGELEQVIRSDGSVSRYCYSTNEFVATTSDGNLRTFFRPKPGKEYWDDEHARN